MSFTIGACVPLSQPEQNKKIEFKSDKLKKFEDSEARQMIAYLFEQIEILKAKIDALERDQSFS